MFVNFGLSAGLGAALGSIFVRTRRKLEDDRETVRMITSDGKLVDVDKKYITKMCSGRVSNKRLRAWLDEEEKNRKNIDS